MPAEEDYGKFSTIAEELGLEDDEKDDFIDSAMARKGYKPQRIWTDPEPESGNANGGEGDFFSRKRAAEQKKNPPGQQKPGNTRQFGGSQYR